MHFRFCVEPRDYCRCPFGFLWLTLIAMTMMIVDDAVPGEENCSKRHLNRRSIRKSATLGGNRVLECDVVYPGGEYVRHIVTWRKRGLEAPIFTLFDGFPPRMDSSYNGRIRMVGQASIEINNITATDEGWYECTVLFLDKSDDMNINGTWIHLSVNSSPVLGKTSPTLLIRKEGESVEMFCEAGGSPSPSQAWLKDGQELRPSGRVTIAANRIRITGVNRMDAGLYVCSFKNIVGATSHLIKLVIQGDGWISSGNVYLTVRPKNTTVLEGGRVKLQCHADGFPDNITYQWLRNGLDIQHTHALSSKAQVLSDGTLIINAVSKELSGWFTCRPSNNLGTPPEAKAYLNVTYYPRVLNMPARVYLPRGMAGRIECPVESNPPLTVILWNKDNVAIDYAQLRHMKASNEGTLVIKPVIASDEGQYTCVPYSPLGRGEASWPVQALVRDPPYFTYRPKPIYQRQPAQSVTMPCVATGDPLPHISWRKPESKLPTPRRMFSHGGNMTVVNLGREDHGLYECIASNVVASVVTTTLLIIELTSLHPPYNVTVETEQDSAHVTWMPAYDGGYPQHYVIWYRTVASETSSSPHSKFSVAKWTTIRVISSNTTSIIVYQLMPDVVYEFMVLSRNRIGDGLFSDVVSAKTKAFSGSWPIPPYTHIPLLINSPAPAVIEDRPEKPYNVTVKLNRHGLLISWLTPQDDYRGGSPLHFAIQYRTVGQWVPLVSRLTGKTSFNWTTASRGATYHFRVVSYRTLNGGSDRQNVDDEETVESLPSDVVTVHTGDPMNDGVKISDATIGCAVGGLFGLLILLGVCLFAVRSFRQWRRRQKALKGHALATSDPDPEPFTENHLDLTTTMTDTKINSVKETPI